MLTTREKLTDLFWKSTGGQIYAEPALAPIRIPWGPLKALVPPQGARNQIFNIYNNLLKGDKERLMQGAGKFIRSISNNPKFDFGSEKEVQTTIKQIVKAISRTTPEGTVRKQYLSKAFSSPTKVFSDIPTPSGFSDLVHMLDTTLERQGFVDTQQIIKKILEYSKFGSGI